MHDPLRDLHLKPRSHAAFLEHLRARQSAARGRAHLDAPGVRRPRRSAGRRGAPDAARGRQRRRQAGRRAAPPASTPRPTACRHQPAADQRLRPAPAAHQRRARLPAGVRPQGAARRADRRSSATAPSDATACTSTTSSTRSSPPPPTTASARCSTSATATTSHSARSPTLIVDATGSTAACASCPGPAISERIDIGSFHTDSTPHRRGARLAATIDLADGIARHGRLLPGASVVPVVDLSRRGRTLRSSVR